ncbi:MAG TPA: hypothetical protein VJ599_00205 [Nitrososphaeraceae archaeon]|nr:hypothetical protein [Nitrososphaeraceae archaeon]
MTDKFGLAKAIAVMTFTIGMTMSTIALVAPFVPASAFSDNEPPEQSCFPPGVEHSSTSQNPNCYDGRIPNCVADQEEGTAGCRNQGTCSEPTNSNRNEETPACPEDEDD